MGADLGLSISETALALNKETLDILHAGDHIQFEATIEGLGDSNHLHHLHSWSIKKLEGHMDVDLHLVDSGRYKLSTHNK
jgi:Co/Zn/Cd efflux system component